MRAVTVPSFGPPSAVKIAAVPMPICGPRDVLIRVAAAGVNPVDWKECEGHLEQFYGRYPPDWVPGYDAAGTIEQVGAEVSDFAPGDRVVAFSDRRENGHNGTFAEYVKVLREAVAKVPHGVSFADAAAVPTAGLTGYQALVRPGKAGLRAGDAVFIHGASGGVGSYAVQIARALGIRVGGSASERKLDYVRSLGAEFAVNYGAGPVAPAVRAWQPGGVAAIIDCVSGGSFPDVFDTLAPCGRWISIATLTQDGDIPGDAALAEAQGFSKIFSIMEFDRIGEELGELMQMLGDGSIRPPPIDSFTLDCASEALEQVKTGHVRGKIVLTVA